MRREPIPLRPLVANQAELMEARLRLKDALVEAGLWVPWEKFTVEDLLESAEARVQAAKELLPNVRGSDPSATDANHFLVESTDATLFLAMALDVVLHRRARDEST